MLKIYKTVFMLILIALLSGCNEKYSQKATPAKKTIPVKNIDSSKITQTKKSPPPLPTHCKKYTDTMNYAYEYVTNEFNKGYFEIKDIEGAKAQIFLIESHSPTIFAQNINAALNSYNQHYNLALQNHCNIVNYKNSLLLEIKNNIQKLENETKEENQ